MNNYRILAENEDYDKLYSDFSYEITKEDIKDLLIGKKLYIPVNDEYAVNIRVKIESKKDEVIKKLKDMIE